MEILYSKIVKYVNYMYTYSLYKMVTYQANKLKIDLLTGPIQVHKGGWGGKKHSMILFMNNIITHGLT